MLAALNHFIATEGKHFKSNIYVLFFFKCGIVENFATLQTGWDEMCRDRMSY